MKPLRKNVALAIDGGGIKGIMVVRALAMLEQELRTPVYNIFRLASGTSTGSIIAAALGAGLSATQMYALYCGFGKKVFKQTWRSRLWPLTRYRYTHDALRCSLRTYLGDITMGDFWKASPATDVVITVFDLVSKRTRFVKSWKEKYAKWPVVTAVLASSAIPTYFPVVEGRYVDGGVGSYANPCYLAAYEARYCLQWDPRETTLISLGTGRDPHYLRPGDADKFWVWNWISPVLGAFLQSADDQQVRLVRTFFKELDFRRFQIDLEKPIQADDPSQNDLLTRYGDELGRKILGNETDWALDIPPDHI
jgi:predicted acylesterase/phospholipase RssA